MEADSFRHDRAEGLQGLTLALDDLVVTWAVGRALGAALPERAIVLCEGGLGSGKTTLIKAVCQGLGIAPRMVISPTYTLVNVYPGRRSVYHVDLFRLEMPEALLELDREDWINPAGMTLIEWPELAGPFLVGESPLEVRLDFVPAHAERRRMTLSGDRRIYGAVFAALEERKGNAEATQGR